MEMEEGSVTSAMSTLCLEHRQAVAHAADFASWHEPCKIAYVESLLSGLSKASLSTLVKRIDSSLRVDFVQVLPDELVEKVFSFLEDKDLVKCCLVSKGWMRLATSNAVWRLIYERRLSQDTMWQELARRKSEGEMASLVSATKYHGLYDAMSAHCKQVTRNWRHGDYKCTVLRCEGNGVYCIQYDNEKLVSGSRDNKIRVWDIATLKCKQTLTGHMGSVLCLQYDDIKIVSGSSDGTARVWELATSTHRATLTHHAESVLHLRFNATRLVTCSKDLKIIVWLADGPFSYQLERVLSGHTAAVNVVDFNDRYIVSASGDRSIRVWDTQTGALERIITGHQRGIACLHYRGSHILTGSSDETVRMWNVDTGQLIFTLRGHTNLVRCIRFNDKYIVSGSYDNSIIIWDVKTGERLATLQGHESRVFRIQFDNFRIISSSQDDTIRVWDFDV